MLGNSRTRDHLYTSVTDGGCTESNRGLRGKNRKLPFAGVLRVFGKKKPAPERGQAAQGAVYSSFPSTTVNTMLEYRGETFPSAVRARTSSLKVPARSVV